jgi:nitroreductase
MSVAEAIRRKRAVRAYTPEPVPEETITAILDAGRRAQSSKNSQPWSFILVTEREQLQRLSSAGNFAAHMPSSAFTVVLVGPPGSEFDNTEAAHAILGVPAELNCRWSITFGYSAEPPRPPRPGGRKPLDAIVHRERY